MARTVDPALTARRRAAILAAAAAEFSAAGFERARASDIAARAGVSSGTVFYYFTDKAGLFRALFGGDIERYEHMRARAFAEADPADGVRLMLDALTDSATDPVAPGLMAELIRRIGADPELAEIVATSDGIARDTLAELIGRGQANGTVDPALDPAHAAMFLISITDGAHLAGGDVRPDVQRAAFAYLAPEGAS
ncbi:Transcriptional regulator, TetR family OS=Tsukamurella paurometabola (strain ATCC 8368 / DSM/ CCUG 35730 / CIP 100753 / JCM 10117 / KCTC 9821 / NBRC 16120/ NCIMB 702349 / NCTC 13040) OX=521096 GN=Tpau_0811 PE=4 SV=1 [Tsukamurella paurometabola]|uniref:Transcriptional regulator, TetR family n=1 Tax=Tsukamurella paurometabola (strain ATCC 8368 / DSM 20162 / CCUG 35730 / CIP 100753 / JCM 10117 / KCTC 9821 / NBRC 16120 / NCIMB 702349 / NCTC 13040) TaxID=521096 RepID=D5UTU3_TSUPD|nr:TetR/AcrR family transcriptional regulator [Tsukamurella paurometabola]ADG77447.1 transcriptional regulator, TetR family [Tsukamurella paurometabola DSM 20162]SUP27083.1 Toluene efflux pump ttgABC operon repressor [Tsukamurella paurometabola]